MFVGCFVAHKEPSERELCGLLRRVVDARVGTSDIQLQFVNLCMDYIHRLHLPGKPDLAKHLVHCQATFTQALQASWRGVKAEKELTGRIATFYSLHKSRLEKVFGLRIHNVCKNLTEPDKCKDYLYHCAKASDLGKALFNETVQTLISNDISGRISKSLVALNNKK